VYAGAREEFVHFRELHARLARWAGPTLLLWGQQDRYVPVRAMRNARRVYPGAHCVVIERCGHCPNLEYPATVAQALRELGA
jgi:pimeloyl-ACP methyl ester carboxylesterase